MIKGTLLVEHDTGRGMYFEGDDVEFDGTYHDLEEAVATGKIEVIFPNGHVATLDRKDLDFGATLW